MDSSKLDDENQLTFNFRAEDKFLVIEDSILKKDDISIYKDGKNVTSTITMTLTDPINTDENDIKVMTYTLSLSNVKDVGAYTIVLKEGVLVDAGQNRSNATTLTFSKSALSSKNYAEVTYYMDNSEYSYAHELYDIDETGTNLNSEVYTPSSLSEIYNDDKNKTFTESFEYENNVQNATGFKGWAEADEDGNIIYYTNSNLTQQAVQETQYIRLFGSYDQIPSTITHLRAVFQEAKVIFVSKNGASSNNGLSPSTPVNNLENAYSKMQTGVDKSRQIIVLMDETEWTSQNDSSKLNKNVTITSLYAGIDYRNQGAKLKVSANISINGDLILDNIEIESTSSDVSDKYLYNSNNTNMLICNYHELVIGRGITTQANKYTFGSIIGGNYNQETTKGTIGIHKMIIERGTYGNIISGSALNTASSAEKYVLNEIEIGNKKDGARAQNDKLIIKGSLQLSQNESKYYAYNEAGSQSAQKSYDLDYAKINLYSGTFSADKLLNTSGEKAAIYLRNMTNNIEGKVEFKMYGGIINGNVYAGSIKNTSKPQDIMTKMKFYGGKVVARADNLSTAQKGGIFGQGVSNLYEGSSEITLSGIFTIEGNVFGGANSVNSTKSYGTANTNIVISSSSVKVNGNIYGGSNGVRSGNIDIQNGYINGSTNISIIAGTVSQNIYGGGYNCGIGSSTSELSTNMENAGTTNINISGGNVLGNIIGGSYQNYIGVSTNIKLIGGTIGKANSNGVYGGNEQTSISEEHTLENTNIIIGENTNKPNILSRIYGGGIYDNINATNIYLKASNSSNKLVVFGGSNVESKVANSNITMQGATVYQIYGGSNSNGTVQKSNINLVSGNVTEVYGGGYNKEVASSEIIEKGTTTGTIYGGSNLGNKVSTSKVTIESGKVTNVFGGGYKSNVSTANINLTGGNATNIYGGSSTSGTVNTSNISLTKGMASNVFGGGYNTNNNNANIILQGASVNNIYGGCNSNGVANNNIINIISGNVQDVFGGNLNGGRTLKSTINIDGTAKITGDVYGGGYKAEIGTSQNKGKVTVNVVKGTVNKNINGGSKESIVYGDIDVKIGKNAVNTQSSIGDINILGNIYGSGSSNKATSTNYDYNYVSVYGNINISVDGSGYNTLNMSSIFGAGNAATYNDTATINLSNVGTLNKTQKIVSIQRATKLNINNSHVELQGIKDECNYYKKTNYTLNRIDSLTIYNNTYLYFRRGINLVKEFNSLKGFDESGNRQLATVTIENGVANKNVDNRIYCIEGINLIFAKQEGDLYESNDNDSWSDINGMTFFGMYAYSRQTGKITYDIYDPNYKAGTGKKDFFLRASYVEGKHKTGHNIQKDGFYTNIGDYTNESNVTVKQDYISVLSQYNPYYDWIIGEDRQSYETTLIASIYSKEIVSTVPLSYNYVPGTTYTLSNISINALSGDVNLVDPDSIPDIAENEEDANNTFGLTVQTAEKGWIKSAKSTIYTEGDGTIKGNNYFASDYSDESPELNFRLYNSINITQRQDLGRISLALVGKTKTGEDVSEGNVFVVIITVNLLTEIDQDEYRYTPSFKNRVETELKYTADSQVDLSYVLYKRAANNIYDNGDYRVLSSTYNLPVGTKITLIDYGQNGNKDEIYYYKIKQNNQYDYTEVYEDETRYIYKFNKFIKMGSEDETNKYIDDKDRYYLTDKKYAFEKYDILINFEEANITSNSLNQHVYMELRTPQNKVKYDQQDNELSFDLIAGKNAIMESNISNNQNEYSLTDELQIPFTFNESFYEQTDGEQNIIDSKYYNKKLGLAFEVIDETGVRIKHPQIVGMKLTIKGETDEEYYPDQNGVVRLNIADGYSVLENQMVLTIGQNSAPTGKYKVKVYLFASDDGLYYGATSKIEQEFYLNIVSKNLGFKVDVNNSNRVIYKDTSLNIDKSKGMKFNIMVSENLNASNLRVVLYKRNPTYTKNSENYNYNKAEYSIVDFKGYFDTSLEKAKENEYIVQNGLKKDENIEFVSDIKKNVSTGEYKLEFKLYSGNDYIQSVEKTFVVIE